MCKGGSMAHGRKGRTVDCRCYKERMESFVQDGTRIEAAGGRSLKIN